MMTCGYSVCPVPVEIMERCFSKTTKLYSCFLRFPRSSRLRFRPLQNAVPKVCCLVPFEPNNKSEPIPYGERVRIILVWCRWRGSNPHALADTGF